MTETPLRYLPHRFDAAALVGVLAEIGLALPNGARILPASDVALSAAGVAFTVAEIDDALAKTELSSTDRFAVKLAMGQHGLIGRTTDA
jgi:hypothetical protein